MMVGEKIANLRKQAGWSQRALATKAGIQQSAVRYAEVENSTTVNQLEKICSALGITLGEFFTDTIETELFQKELLREVIQLQAEESIHLAAFLRAVRVRREERGLD